MHTNPIFAVVLDRRSQYKWPQGTYLLIERDNGLHSGYDGVDTVHDGGWICIHLSQELAACHKQGPKVSHVL